MSLLVHKLTSTRKVNGLTVGLLDEYGGRDGRDVFGDSIIEVKAKDKATGLRGQGQRCSRSWPEVFEL